MGHIGTGELIVILLIALVLFGGKRVSGLGKALGTSLREFRTELDKKEEAPHHGDEAIEPAKD